MANTVKPKGNIYNLAKLAKERLKQNNYTKVKGNVINTATTFATYISKQKVNSTKSVDKNLSVNYDEELYNKVCKIIESKNTTNPISMLIDKNLFNSLDAEAKQFYINNLTQKYKFMRNRYFKEHPLSLFI